MGPKPSDVLCAPGWWLIVLAACADAGDRRATPRPGVHGNPQASPPPCSVCNGISAASDPSLVSAASGSAPRLLFGCVGDTRPPTEDDTANYPTHIVTSIFARIDALRPRPPFSIATGDYVFASNGAKSQADPQFDLYLGARSLYRGVLFPTMGNHECTGATASNCGPEALDGVTRTYDAFLRKMLFPIHTSEPYYFVRIDAPDASWTAKFVFIAANAWSVTQQSWLESALVQPTTYTFIVRHEPASATNAPGVVPSETVIRRHPYTLVIVGHSHTYRHELSAPREVLIGNGGAPLSGKDFGFGLFAQRADGAIVVDMLHWQTSAPDPEFHFVVTPEGTQTL